MQSGAKPRPRPPYSSGKQMLVQPRSAICFHTSRENPTGSFASRRRRIRSLGVVASTKLLAVWASRSCSSSKVSFTASPCRIPSDCCRIAPRRSHRPKGCRRSYFCTAPSGSVLRLYLLKTAVAGSAGSPTHLSLVDRDLLFQYRKVVAADGAPTPPGRIEANLTAIRGYGSRRIPSEPEDLFRDDVQLDLAAAALDGVRARADPLARGSEVRFLEARPVPAEPVRARDADAELPASLLQVAHHDLEGGALGTWLLPLAEALPQPLDGESEALDVHRRSRDVEPQRFVRQWAFPGAERAPRSGHERLFGGIELAAHGFADHRALVAEQRLAHRPSGADL